MDQVAPARGPFRFAHEWAAQLGVPLYGVFYPNLAFPDAPPANGGADREEGQRKQVQGLATACAQACARRGIAWQVGDYEELRAEPSSILTPVDLIVVGPGIPTGERKRLLRYSIGGATPAVHACPATWSQWSRALVLYEEEHYPEGFLGLALELCVRLRVKPVILTVARSERMAQLRQAALQELLSGWNWDCDFDLLVGGEVRLAVTHVARWRRCQVIMMERQAAPPWWRWWHGSSAEKFMGSQEEYSFLTLPGSGLLASSPESAPGAPARWYPSHYPARH